MFDPQHSSSGFYEERRQEFNTLFRPLVSRIQKYSPKGKILDVGCSSGILLSLLRRKNRDVYGIEPNKYAYRIAFKKLKNRVHKGTLKSFRTKKKRSFDCIIYNHVLEHIENIHVEFALIKKTLKKNGILVLGLPNTDNVIFLIRGKYWESLVPNEHIWHFNTKELIRFLDKQGFKIKDISFTDDKRKDYPFIKKIYFRTLSLINRLIHTGENVLIIAEKIG